MIDSPYLVRPGAKFKLSKVNTSDTGKFKDKREAAEESDRNLERLEELQRVLYAERKHAMLVVLQAMDTAGKDGAISHVFSGVNPQGCAVTSFKVPTELEREHDFLWRVHNAVPPAGMIGIFNRSHYESVLVERVKKLVPKEVWSQRYEMINEFERMLSAGGVTILKFFLHISREEQKSRLESRLNDPSKNWKFNPGDLDDRKLWDDYQAAYEDALQRCSTKDAPWYVVPADHKWFRNWMISDTIVKTLKALKMKYPKADPSILKIKIR